MDKNHQFQILMNALIMIENGSAMAEAPEEFRQEARDALVKAGIYRPRMGEEDVRHLNKSIANFQRLMAIRDLEKLRKIKKFPKYMEN
jgi:hypothetical protein